MNRKFEIADDENLDHIGKIRFNDLTQCYDVLNELTAQDENSLLVNTPTHHENL